MRVNEESHAKIVKLNFEFIRIILERYIFVIRIYVGIFNLTNGNQA